MKRKHANVLTTAALIMIGTGGFALAGEKVLKTDLGKREYENSCAVCHGKDGKGAGSINDLLKKSPTDLTTLAKKNNGVFPVDRLYAVIGSRTPRCYRCPPKERDLHTRHHFTSLRYGDAGYCQLRQSTSDRIRLGAHDESEMGVLHGLFQPQRETNLRVRMEEYLRFGLEAGLTYGI